MIAEKIHRFNNSVLSVIQTGSGEQLQYDDHTNCALGFYKKGKEEKLPTVNQLQLYPNPTNGELWISVANVEDKDYQIRISSLQGTTLLTTLVAFYKGKAKINIGDLATGVYLVSLWQGDEQLLVNKVTLVK